MFQADWFCGPCGEAIKETIDIATLPYPGEGLFREWYLDSDSFPIEYDSSEGESDTPDHCAKCELFLERNLTEDGIEYVKEKARTAPIVSGNMIHHLQETERCAVCISREINEIIRQWVDYYDIEVEVTP